MKKINDWLFKSYRLIIGSIAFYPTIITMGFFGFSIIINLIEYRPWMMDLKETLSFILVKSKEDARLVLGTLVGSIISLMVFSFSMVMVVLNRASATLSPRVIPGLITHKSNQTVLGFYLGSIVYCLILIVNIQSEGSNSIPDFGILMAMIFGIMCLGFFMFFIHSISQSIQVDNILKRIQGKTERRMESLSLADDEDLIKMPETEEWLSLKSPDAGYIKEIKVKELLKMAKKHKLKIKLDVPIGYFLVEGYPYLKINKQTDKEVEQEIHNCFISYPQEWLDDHYSFGFKQISEIAVKALSPGINDPGTAVKAINLLSVLFIQKMKITDKYFVTDDDNEPRLFFEPIELNDLLYQNLTSIREYGKTDALVMITLLNCLKNILYADQQCQHHSVIIEHIESIAESCKEHITNSIDMKNIQAVLKSIAPLTQKSLKVDLDS